MKKQNHAPPETLDEFATYLRTWCGNIEHWIKHPDGMHENEPYDCAALVYEASVFARRLGLGHLAERRRSHLSRDDALAALGRMLAGCEQRAEEQLPPDAELTVAESAKRLNVAEQTVYDLVKNGKVSHKRYGVGRGTIRIRLGDLTAYQKQQETIGAKSKKPHVTLAQLRSV